MYIKLRDGPGALQFSQEYGESSYPCSSSVKEMWQNATNGKKKRWRKKRTQNQTLDKRQKERVSMEMQNGFAERFCPSHSRVHFRQAERGKGSPGLVIKEAIIPERSRGLVEGVPTRGTNNKAGETEMKGAQQDPNTRERKTPAQLISAAKRNVPKTAAITITREEGGLFYVHILYTPIYYTIY